MQKKSENVAHAPDGIKLKNLKNSVACGIRLQQSVKQEIAEMRRQIAELKAEAAQDDNEDKDEAQSGRP